jgi:pyruvate dehydrogenase E2 component (dihydrolipoamide acetyltransferase)
MSAITMPKMSDTMEEGKIVRWLKREGDQVTEGESIAEIETDKANVEMEAFEAGVIKDIVVKEGETVPVGQAIAELEPAGAPAAAKAPEPEAPTVTAPPPPKPVEVPAPQEIKPREAAPEEERIKASPLARKIAEEKGIDLSKVHGTGPNGRIVESDVEGALQQAGGPGPAQGRPPTPTLPPLVGEGEQVGLSKMRKAIGERMVKSKQTIPHFYVTSEVEMDWASRVRDELNQDESQTKVSFTDLIVKAAALALTKFPNVNASYSDGKLQVHKQINVAIAVALEEGLVAPVIHDADKKPLRQMAAETKELAQHARDNQLRAHEITGATFTISNLGMFDVESFIAIINPPECASMAVGSIREIPVIIEGSVAASKRMKVTVSADHRVLDGAVAAKFLQEFKRRIESPVGLL